MFRLLRTNQFFHEEKRDIQETQAEEYISKICEIVGLDPNQTTYTKLK